MNTQSFSAKEISLSVSENPESQMLQLGKFSKSSLTMVSLSEGFTCLQQSFVLPMSNGGLKGGLL